MPAQLQTLQTLQTLSLSRLGRLRRQELAQRHVLRLVFLGLVVLSLAGLLYLTQASAVTTTTYEIQELQRDKQRLQRRRDELRAKLAVLTSPERVRARAVALGFEESAPAEYLVVSEIPVMVQRSPAISPTDTSPAPLERILTQTSNWLQAAVGLLPAPQQVEAGTGDP